MKDVPGFWLPLLPKVMDVLAKRIEYSKMDLIGFLSGMKIILIIIVAYW